MWVGLRSAASSSGLIRKMSNSNVTWGAPRIRNELDGVGTEVHVLNHVDRAHALLESCEHVPDSIAATATAEAIAGAIDEPGGDGVQPCPTACRRNSPSKSSTGTPTARLNASENSRPSPMVAMRRRMVSSP